MRLVAACWAVGAASGALLNALNGQICPAYFQRVLHWDFPGVAAAAMLQGVFEGSFYAVLVALVLGWSWMRGGGDRPGRRALPGIVGWWAAGALVGGGMGCGFAAWSADFFTATFPPSAGLEGTALLRFAWVGGSIQGALLGAALGTLGAAARLRRPEA